jgi:hypothetical protein
MWVTYMTASPAHRGFLFFINGAFPLAIYYYAIEIKSLDATK